jgi:5,10-methylenetetrahydromethanopterin reductase
MRISRFITPTGTLAEYVDELSDSETAGFSGVWVPEAFTWDPLATLALVAERTSALRLGTAVVQVHARHPLSLASAAMTTQAASHGRLTLGLGTSHRIVVADALGMSFARPRHYLSECLDVLGPAMTGAPVEIEGEAIRAVWQRGLLVPGGEPPPILIAAMGPAMLRLAGSKADGTITWMTGPRTLREHIVPTLTKAAEIAGRPAPTVAAGLPICVTKEFANARERARKRYVGYDTVPSYRAMLDREGHAVAGDIALIGGAEQLTDTLNELAASGVTEICAELFGTDDENAATVDFLTGFTGFGH